MQKNRSQYLFSMSFYGFAKLRVLQKNLCCFVLFWLLLSNLSNLWKIHRINGFRWQLDVVKHLLVIFHLGMVYVCVYHMLVIVIHDWPHFNVNFGVIIALHWKLSRLNWKNAWYQGRFFFLFLTFYRPFHRDKSKNISKRAKDRTLNQTFFLKFIVSRT